MKIRKRVKHLFFICVIVSLIGVQFNVPYIYLISSIYFLSYWILDNTILYIFRLKKYVKILTAHIIYIRFKFADLTKLDEYDHEMFQLFTKMSIDVNYKEIITGVHTGAIQDTEIKTYIEQNLKIKFNFHRSVKTELITSKSA